MRFRGLVDYQLMHVFPVKPFMTPVNQSKVERTRNAYDTTRTVEGNVDSQPLGAQIVRHKFGHISVIQGDPGDIVESVYDENERNDSETHGGITSIGESGSKAHDEAESETHTGVRDEPHGSTTDTLAVGSRGEGDDHIPSGETGVDTSDGQGIGDADCS